MWCAAAVSGAQTVSTKFDGVAIPIRLEFWSQADGDFSWIGEQRRATGTWIAAQQESIERGVSYWWDILGPSNVPGRTITVRVLRSGEESDSPGVWETTGTNAHTVSIVDGGYYKSLPLYVWAEGGVTTSPYGPDTVINFDDTETASARNGPMQLALGVNVEITMIHELGHALGVTTAGQRWGMPSGSMTPFESMLVTLDGNTRVPVVINEPIDQHGRYYFNGANSRAVYGDVAVGQAGRPVPMTADSLQKSHFGIDAFTMTHENYRNYPFYSEVELAALQDLGYAFDRRDFFGRSIYTDGDANVAVIENADGFNSSSTYGVGFHLKANRREVIQKADLIASGVAGNGIRIDGNENVVTIDQGVTVSANGDYGVGLIVSNGKFNEIVHRGDLVANSTTPGALGTGMFIGFGLNTLGPDDVRTSGVASAWSGGYLVDQIDLTGSISATGQAIVIDQTAAVKELNVMAGAAIVGDIESNALIGTPYDFKRPLLTFGREANGDGRATNDADAGFAFDYAGNIGGATLMDAKVYGGAEHATGARFTGNVAFHSVEVAPQGRLAADGSLSSVEAIEVYGTLQSVGGVIASQECVVVYEGGRLAGTPTITAPLVDNRSGGVMFAGNSVGTMTIIGNLQSNGDLQFDLTHQHVSQDASLYRIENGVAAINNDVPFVSRGAFQFDFDSANPADFQISRRYTVIETDAPGQLQIHQRPAAEDDLDERRIILRSDVDTNGFDTAGAQSYYAYVGRDLPFASLGETSNQRAVGQYLDDLFALDDGSPLADEVQWFRDSLDLMPNEADVLALLSQMTGELYASINPMIVQQAFIDQNRLANRLRQHHAPAVWCGDDQPTGSAWGGWIAGFGVGGATESNGNAAGYHYASGGTQAVVTYALTPQSKVGGYYNFAGAKFSDSPLGSANVDANEFGFLFNHQGDAGHFTLIAGGGAVDARARRRFVIGNPAVQDPLLQLAQGEYDGSFANVYGEVGRRFEGEMLAVRPFMGLGYVIFAHDPFTETGSGLGRLAVDGDSVDSLRTLLGVDGSLLLREAHSLRLDSRAVWMRDLLNGDVATISSQFADAPGIGFAVAGANIGRDFALLGTSLSRSILVDNLRAFAGYDLLVSDMQSLHAGNGGVALLW